MAIATFDGVACFGIGDEATVMPNPPRIQYNAYSGVQGVETIMHGGTGATAEGTFLATFFSTLDLTDYESFFFYALRNGVVGNYSDNVGRTWPNARLIEFRPVERVTPDGFGGCSRTYYAKFFIPDY